MIRSFLTTTLRGLLKNKPYFFINTLGLALGVCGALIIFTKIRYELSFDTFHAKANRIYRINTDELHPNGANPQPGTYYPVAQMLRNDFPAMLESVTHTKYEEEGQVTLETSAGELRFKEEGIGFVEPQFLDIFDFCTDDQWLAGNRETALVDKNSVVLTETLAQKYFQPQGDYSSVLGKRLLYGNKIDLVVTGVVKDFPPSTDFPFHMLVPYVALDGYDEFYSLDKWNFLADNVQCYVLLYEDYSPDQLAAALPDFEKKHIGEEKAERISFSMQPLSDIHFNPKYGNFQERTMRYEVLWSLAIVAILLIVTACINFVNLATAQSVKRSKEVGIRKVLGSSRKQLVTFFLGETFIITAFAVLIALGAAEAFLFKFRHMLDIGLDINLVSLPATYLFLGTITLLVTLLAGLYPAWVLTAFKPIFALKNSFSAQISRQSKNFSLRKGLVIVQFAISQILIIGTLVVSQQMQFFQNKSLGFDKDAIITAPLPDTVSADKLNALKNQLLDNPYIRQVSFGIGSPTSENNLDTKFKITSMSDEQAYSTEVKTMDEDYLSVFGLQLVAGRALTQQDLQNKRALVNETLAKTAGFSTSETIIGHQMQVLGDTYEIIGVVKDFHTQSLHENINPCVLFYFPHFLREAAIKINTQGGMTDVQSSIAHLEKVWNTTFPEYVFEYQFLDDFIASNYEQETKTFQYFQLFAGLAILIGCLGLYGLVSFMAEQKTKEVGIRKVLGASVSSIIGLFSKEYVLLIVLAFFVAAPVAYYFMHNWLENFAYRIDLKAGVFAIGILISLGIAFLTVGYKSYRAAIINPVDSLKDE